MRKEKTKLIIETASIAAVFVLAGLIISLYVSQHRASKYSGDETSDLYLNERLSARSEGTDIEFSATHYEALNRRVKTEQSIQAPVDTQFLTYRKSD